MNNRNLLFTILGLLLIIPIGYATAGLIIDPTTQSEAVDTRHIATSGFANLDGPTDVKVFYNGTNPYAIVTSLNDDAVTIVDLTDPLNPKALSTETDSLSGVGVMAMAQPRAVQVWQNSTVGGGYFAAVASQVNDGVQILDINDPEDIGTNSRTIFNATDISPAGSTGGGSFESHAGRATTGHFNSLTLMNQASDIALINNGTETSPAYFVAVAGFLGDGVQIYDARDVGDEGGHFQIAGNASNTQGIGTGGANTGRLVLDGVTGIDTFTLANSTLSSTDQTYLIATAFVEDGLQVIRVTNPFVPHPGTNVTKAATGFANLESATDVATWQHAGTPYAIVTSSANDAVTVIDLSGASASVTAGEGGCTPDRNQQGGSTCLLATDTLTDAEGDLALDGANQVEIVQIGADKRNYAIVTANASDAGGIQIIDLYDPYNIQPVDRLFGNSTHAGIRGGWGLDTFTYGDDTYAVIAQYHDDAIQVVKLTGLKQNTGSNAVCGVNRDCSAPSINNEVDGFSINGANLPNNDRYNYPDETNAKVGKLVTIKAKIEDSFGVDAVSKANLYFDMPNVPEWASANAAIEYDIKRDSLKIKDTNNIFDADVSTRVVGDRLEVTYKIMFTDVMETSHIAFQSVDSDKNYQLLYFKNALTVTGQSTNPTQTSTDETLGDEVTQTSIATVPEWVKNTAGWWAEGQISETEFVKGVEFLIKQQIINTEVQTTTSEGTGSSVPEWVKNTAGWWADGQISENEFVSAIEHLVKTGTIIVI